MSGYKRVNFYDLCRLCAQNIHRNKIKIFAYQGQKSQLQANIKKCLSINVTEQDFLPKVVCTKCIRQLEICNAFREECLNSENMLSTYFKNYRHTKDFKKSGQVYIKDKADTGEAAQPVSINKGNSIVASKSINNQVTVLQPSVDPLKLEANNTKSTESEIKNPKLHDPHTLNTIPCTLPYGIDILNEALKKAVHQLNKVIVNSNGEVINLPSQDSSNNSDLLLSQGIMSVIKKQREEKQEVKSEKSDNKGVVKIDLTSDEGDLKFAQAAAFCKPNQNTAVPTAPQNPTVILPVSQFQNNFAPVSSPIYPHQTTVNMTTSNPTVINVICNNTSEQSTPLPSVSTNPSSVNLEDLQPAQDYISEAATKPKKAPAVKQTKPKIDEVKTHACEVCAKTFKRREHLYQHVKLHTGFRPFHCTECKKCFVRKEHLLRHMVLHSGERNFACDVCSKSFSRHDNLLKHIRTHNKEASYTCDVCQKVFIMKNYYDTHRSEHGKCYVPPHLRGS